jgi:FAD binding domain/Berberine and berberine like
MAPAAQLKDFPAAFRGDRILPAGRGYAEARQIFNMRRADETPALIARAADPEDVVHVMRYASSKGIPLAIRGGGHGVDGSAMPDGALVLDLSRLKSIDLDPSSRRCRVESGVLLGELDAATQTHGLVVPAGTVSTTGIAGLTLGGGVGYNMRRYGATVDSLRACEVVTVDGRKIRASATENTDLYWAMRGGGGNFGVVTAFEFDAHPMPAEVFAGVIIFSAEHAAEVLAGLRDYARLAPRELAIIAASTACPPFPPVPADVHGTSVQMLIMVYTGAPGNAPIVIRELSRLGPPIAVLVGPRSWVETNRLLDAVAPYGRRTQTRGGYLSELSDRVIAAVVKNMREAPMPASPLPGCVQNLWCMGGAISEDFDEDSAAFSREGAAWLWEAVGQWDDRAQDAAYDAWTECAAGDVSADLRANGYVNLTTDRGPEWLRGLYGSASKYRRLLEAKLRWDPGNILRFNKNFKVSAGDASAYNQST